MGIKSARLLSSTRLQAEATPATIQPTEPVSAPVPPVEPPPVVEPEQPEIEKKPRYMPGDVVSSNCPGRKPGKVISTEPSAEFCYMVQPDEGGEPYMECEPNLMPGAALEPVPADSPAVAAPASPAPVALDLSQFQAALGLSGTDVDLKTVLSEITALKADRDGMMGDRDTELKAAGMPENRIARFGSSCVRASGESWKAAVEREKMADPALFNAPSQSKVQANAGDDVAIVHQAKIPDGVDLGKPAMAKNRVKPARPAVARAVPA